MVILPTLSFVPHQGSDLRRQTSGKHQVGLTWNEISRRYVEPQSFTDLYHKCNYGSAPTTSRAVRVSEKGGGTTQDVVAHTILMAQKHYRKLLEEGVAPEMARMILPQNTMTEWYWYGSTIGCKGVQPTSRPPLTTRNSGQAALIHQHCQQLTPSAGQH